MFPGIGTLQRYHSRVAAFSLMLYAELCGMQADASNSGKFSLILPFQNCILGYYDMSVVRCKTHNRFIKHAPF